jgi:ribosomal protein L24
MKKYDWVRVISGNYEGCYGEIINITDNVLIEIEDGFVMLDTNELEVIYSI